MKKLLLPLLLLGGLFANADLVVEQKVESTALNGKMVIKMKGDQARMDLPTSIAGEVSMVVDLKGGQAMILAHSQKVAMKQSLTDLKKQAQEKEKEAGIDPAKIEKPKATGKKEKVGDWDTEIFETTIGGNPAQFWVAKDFPNYKAVTEQMKKLSVETGGGGYESQFDLGGMVVKTDMTVPGLGKIVATVVKVKEEAVAESEFKAPADYQSLGQ